MFIVLVVHAFWLQATVRALKSENEQLTDANTDLNADIKSLIDENAILTVDLEQAKQDAQVNGNQPSNPKQPKFAYLTFDDGPSANTDQILNVLRDYGVKGTFFVIGSETEYGKHLYKRIVEEGHAIALHSYDHSYANVYQSEEAFMESMYSLRDLIKEVTGVTTDILRFPGGSNTGYAKKYGGAGLARALVNRIHREGMQYFDWNVSSQDATKVLVDTETIIQSTLRGASGRDQAIVLMHDAPAKTTTVEALPAIIEGLQKQGYTFEVLKRDTPPAHFYIP